MVHNLTKQIIPYLESFGFLQKRSTFLKAVFVVSLLISFSGFGQTVSITASTPNANEAGLLNGEYTISVAGAGLLTDLEVFLNVDASSTATSGVDHTILPVSVNIPLILGVGAETVNLEPLQDFLAEGNETVVWNITPNVGYVIDLVNSSATVTILDNDAVGINVTPTSGTTTEAGGTATFSFTLDSEPTGAVTIPITGYDTT
ncbi:MAG: hypothetical protein AAF039_16875, partial [Bacteroidota bacterium]